MAKTRSSLMYILLLLSFSVPTARAADHRALVIHSYDQGYSWSTDVNRGILDVAGDELSLDYYYMDTKRVEPARAFAAARASLAIKYEQSKPDILITVDDDALRFLLAVRQDLFADVPVAFCGINIPALYTQEQIGSFSGVAESPDVGGTLDLIFKLFPRTDTLLVFGDDTTTGRLNRSLFEDNLARVPAGVTVRRLAAPEVPELEAELRSLPARSAVLYLSWLLTRSGRILSVTESMTIVTAAAPAPVFSCWDFMVIKGAVGGRVVSGYLQGREAGAQVLRTLRGEHILDPAAAARQTHRFQFDWQALKRFDANLLMVPKKSVLIGGPKSLDRPTLLWIIALSGISALEAFSILVILNERRRLAATEKRYRTLTEHIPAAVYSVQLGENGRTTYISPRIYDLLGYTTQEWLADKDLWIKALSPEDRSAIVKTVSAADLFHRDFTIDYRATTRSGGIVWLRNQAHYLSLGNNAYEMLGFISDISAEKESERVLKTALAEKEMLLKEVHHRVKNNFQVVNSLLRLEGAQLQSEEARRALDLAESRIHAMALVHERLYMEGNFVEIDLRSYLESLAGNLETLVRITGDSVAVPLETAVPLGLFCNEALMNVAKHAFPPEFTGNRDVGITLGQQDRAVWVEIADSGVGLGQKDPLAAKSLGFTLMNALSTQIGGTHRIVSSSSGTTVRIEFRV